MADFAFSLESMPILGGVDRAIGSNRIVERTNLALVSIAIPLRGEDALTAALKDGWGLDWPDPVRPAANGDYRAIRTAPDQLLLIFPHPTPDAERVVASKLDGAGYTTDQSDVWVTLEISGPDTLAALERLCPLDTARMAVGGSARTVMEHMGAMILRLSQDRFLLLSASSSANSFLQAVEESFHYTVA